MIILGLGTNLGDRLSFLREALRRIRDIPSLSVKQVSPLYLSDALLPENATVAWDRPYLNAALRCETSLSPYHLLSEIKRIEKEMGRVNGEEWGPRVIDIDLLAYNQLIQYDDLLHIPHEHLHERPFALWPLADVAPFWVCPLEGPWLGKTAFEMAAQWGSRWEGAAPLRTRQIQQRIDSPKLMGILNLTPDSFSSDGKLDRKDQWHTILSLIEQGATGIDIGAEATGPRSKALSAEEEQSRLLPILRLLAEKKSSLSITPYISIDTYHPDTAHLALEYGVDCINDVSGLQNTEMLNIVLAHTSDVVLMHQLGIPANKAHYVPLHQNITSTVLEWGRQHIERLVGYGIALNRIIFDPGIGYGKTAEQDIELIKNIAKFKELGVRLLVGHSRKYFLSTFTSHTPPARDIETLAVSQYLFTQSIDIIRVHNIEAHARTFKISTALSSA